MLLFWLEIYNNTYIQHIRWFVSFSKGISIVVLGKIRIRTYRTAGRQTKVLLSELRRTLLSCTIPF
jgi:hypothetical protein